MKKLLTILLFFIASTIAYSQCPPVKNAVVKWSSTTHDYYAPRSPYRFDPVIPTTPDPYERLFYEWLGKGTNSYRITAPTGDQPFSYQFKIGAGNGVDGISAFMTMYLYSSSNGKASSIKTNFGTISNEDLIGGIQKTNSIVSFIDSAPGYNRTITFPANPYKDRSLTIVIMVKGFNVYRKGCESRYVELNYFFPVDPPYDYPVRVDQMYTPWVEITIPPSK